MIYTLMLFDTPLIKFSVEGGAEVDINILEIHRYCLQKSAMLVARQICHERFAGSFAA